MSRHDELNTLSFYAFRYALGRMTYAVADVCIILHKNIKKIDPYNRELMIKEISQAIEDGCAGQRCDVLRWKHLLEALIDVQREEAIG